MENLTGSDFRALIKLQATDVNQRYLISVNTSKTSLESKEIVKFLLKFGKLWELADIVTKFRQQF